MPASSQRARVSVVASAVSATHRQPWLIHMREAMQLDDLDAAGAGHVDVQQHEIEMVLLERVEGGIAVVDQHGDVAGPAQNLGGHLAVHRIVLGDQDAHRLRRVHLLGGAPALGFLAFVLALVSKA